MLKFSYIFIFGRVRAKMTDAYKKSSASAEKIKRAFANNDLQIEVFSFEETDSTNTRAKLFAKSAAADGKPKLFIAQRQSGGRGRLGRRFASDMGTGLYMSVLFYPDRDLDIMKITPFAAVAAVRALEPMIGAEIGIKWVNDLWLSEKKLAGILTECGFSEDGSLSYAVMGIGINLYRTAFPPELADIATDIESELGIHLERETLAAKITENFLDLIEKGDTGAVLSEYRKRSVLIGSPVDVFLGNEKFRAEVLRINDDFGLGIMLENGETRTLSSGEVSVRKVK